MKRRYWWGVGLIILGTAITVSFRTCGSQTNTADYISEEQREALESGLTLRDVTLEQQDETGVLLWRVHAAEVTYSPDQESADLVDLEGEFYQDGQLLYRVKADAGTLIENGQIVLLRDNIVATGVQNQMILWGDFLEWLPEQDLMILKEGITGVHPQVRASAHEARVYDREQRMELIGQVVATTVVEDPQIEPWLKLQGETLEWHWAREEISSSQAIRVERFQSDQITEVLTGNQGLVELAENRATLTESVTIQLLEIPLEMTSENAIWEVDEQRVKVDRPVKVVNEEQAITVTAQEGELDIVQEIVYFYRNVVVVGERNDSRLTADTLTWDLSDQTILAEGTVNYQQSNPQIIIQGPRARGRIEEQIILIDGGQVTTEIVPNE